LGGHSIWPFVTLFWEGLSGRERSSLPEATILAGNLTYGQASNLLVVGLLLVVAGLLFFGRGSTKTARGYLPLVAVGMLGWNMFLTGMVSRYFLYALALIIASRASIRPGVYYPIVATLSITIFVTVYASIGYAIQDVPHLAPALHSSNNPVTRFVMYLVSVDWFITLSSFANLMVLFWLATETIQFPGSFWGRWRKAVADGSRRLWAKRPAGLG